MMHLGKSFSTVQNKDGPIGYKSHRKRGKRVDVLDSETFLYRHFDFAGLLLYVGISNRTIVRLSTHQSTSTWFRDIATVKIQRYTNRWDARVAEYIAIKEEHPLHNSPKWRRYFSAEQIESHKQRMAGTDVSAHRARLRGGV